VRSRLQEKWIVLSKDAIKFGADFLLYKESDVHSTAAVYVDYENNMNLLEAQRFSRICESVKKKAVVARKKQGEGRDGIEFIEISRGIDSSSL
jgi:tRNA splicing endonuclease